MDSKEGFEEVTDEINNNIRSVQDQIREYKKYQKEIPSGQVRMKRDLEIGTKVLIYKQPPRNPLDKTWVEGYKITKLIGTDSYELTNGNKRLILNKIHVKRDTTI